MNVEDIVLPDWVNSVQTSAMQNLLGNHSREDFISFALGLPAIEFFPKAIFQETVHELIDHDSAALQYAPPLESLKAHIKSLMQLRGVNCNEKQIFLTAGAQQGINLLMKLLLESGSKIIVEELIYPGALQALAPFTPEILTVSTDLNTGINVEQIKKLLKKGSRPACIYIMCDGNNPYGVSIEEQKRIQLAELAQQYGVPIIEDDAYGFVSYEKGLPCLKHYGGDWVFYVGSFSKVFAPSLRVGWIVAPEFLMPKLAILKESSDINITTFGQRLTNRFLEKNIFPQHIQTLCKQYKERRDCLVDALREYFPKEAKFHIPMHGIFIWVELPKSINTSVLLEISLKQAGVAFIPSLAFAATPNISITNAMRLNFSHPTPVKIQEGIRRLGRTLLTG